MENQIEELSKERKKLVEKNSSYDQVVGEVKLINKWKRADIGWLDVLTDVSNQLPLPDDVIIDGFDAKLQSTAERSVISISGRISNSDLDTKIEKQLREKFLVSPLGTEPLAKDELFSRKMKKELALRLDNVEIVEDPIEEEEPEKVENTPEKKKSE